MMKKIAIIGAGIAGLTVAQKLQRRGLKVDIFDKGRGVGGRMSSRRTDWGYLDHGCQYFTVKDPSFANFLQEYGEVVMTWRGVFARWQDGNFTLVEEENPRYVPPVAMNNLCKAIAAELNVKLKTRIVKLAKSQTLTLIDEEGNQYNDYDMVIVTAPPAQSQDLLNNHTPIAYEIKDINMLPCYSLMLTLEQEVNFPFDGIELQHPVLGWIAANHSKPLRGEKKSLVIQSNFTWARNNLNRDRAEVTKNLKSSASKIFDVALDNSLYQSLHLWRYALPQAVNEKGYYFDEENAIAVCGDWCIKGKVESAFLSANLLADTLQSFFQN